MEPKKAYVTILSTDSYLTGVLALFESLKNTQPKINSFVVIINEKISQKTINILHKKGYIVIEKNAIPIPESIKTANSSANKLNWTYTFDKFNLFELNEFSKIVYLDSDMYIAKNIDELFDKPDMSGVIAGKSYPGNESWNELNSGIMVIEPKIGIIDKLVNTMIQMSTPSINNSPKQNNYNNLQRMGDQEVIEEYYHWKDNPELELDEKYNIFADYVDYYIDKVGYSKEDLAVIHFIGNKKPWMLTEIEIEEYEENCKKSGQMYQLDFFKRYIEIIKNTMN